jgi:peptide/nickel transport system permease protein
VATNIPVLTPVPSPTAIDFETTKEVGYYRLVWRRFKSRRIALVAAITLALLIFACYILPFALPSECVDLNQTDLGPLSTATTNSAFCPGSHFHLLGTDSDGRDLLLRNLKGGQVSLLVGFTVTILTMLIATTMGALAGFLGGVVDAAISAVTNAVLSIPSILILIIFVKTFNSNGQFGPLEAGFFVVLGISLIFWPTTARIVRSVVLSVREKEFVEAARAVGTSRLRIITRHLLPNALGPIVVSASLTVGAAILTESALSFLGYGINPPTATWGNLLDDGRNKIFDPNGVYFALWPGFLILITVLSFNYIGDALRDAFDPRSLER